MEDVDEKETVVDGCLAPALEGRERKLSDISVNAEEKRSDTVTIFKTPSVERKISKSASEEISTPLVFRRIGSKSSDPKAKEEKKKKRKSLVSFAGRHVGFRKKDASASKLYDKDETRTPPVGSPSSPAITASSPMAHVRIKTPDEELAALTVDTAADFGDTSECVGQEPAVGSSAGTEERLYDAVPPLSPVSETRPELEGDDVTLSQPTVSELRDVALRTALGLPPVPPERLEWARRAGLAWLPDGLGAEDAFEFWPAPKEAPWLESEGARLRQVNLLRQLPAADLRQPNAGSGMAEFAAARDRVALGEGRVLRLETAAVCGGCGEEIPADRLAVIADLLPAAAWHPGCFSCTTCGQRLADLLYCNHRGKPLCIRHFGEQLKDRCVSCDELIFDGEFQRAGDLAWHSAHLVCASCETPLVGKQFGLHGRQPYCMQCYETASLGSCEGCGLAVRPSGRRLQYGSSQWHPKCFVCGWCAVPLEGGQFALREGRPVCSGCSSRLAPPPCPRCDVCGLPVAADCGLIEYKAGRCHDACFVCCVCSVPLGERTFMPKDQRLYCLRCYEETFAARCAKCNETIAGLGVTFQDETWHRECFLCSLCKTSLAGRKFRSHEKKPYCKDCYRDTFGKRCSRCHGVLEGRYSAYQNRSWHNECFTCVDCNCSLVGLGFVDIDGDVLCQQCALQRQQAELDRLLRPEGTVLAD